VLGVCAPGWSLGRWARCSVAEWPVAGDPDRRRGWLLCPSPVPAGQQPRGQGGPLKEMHPIAPRRRPNPPCFMHLYRRVLTRSRPPESPKANQFLAHLALLVGPEALSRPATAQKSLGGGGGRAPESFLAAFPQMEGGTMAIAADVRIPSFVFSASWVPCSSGRRSIGSS
jgi:hypothetical protein